MSKSKNILITGASGFVGVNLLNALINEGHHVETFSSKEGDISTAELKFESIDHIFHLAGKTFVPDSWNSPKEFYQTNVMGATNVLEFARTQGASVTLMSSYVYGEPQYLPIDENHPVGAYNPYCQTKILSEDIGGFYSKNFDVDCTVFRPFNIYGNRQNENFLIPTIIKQVLDPTTDSITLMSLNPKRDYVHVSDVVNALLSSIECKGFSTYNIGSGESYSVKEIVDMVQSIAGSNKGISSNATERKNEVMDVVANISKLKNELSWQPKTSLQEGLRQIIQDYLSVDSK